MGSRKIEFECTYPAVSICDLTYTFSVLAYQTTAGSADIMSHIFDGYFSRTEPFPTASRKPSCARWKNTAP